jgi:glutamate-1-semialdehyde 2,1-aminomutase
MTNAQRINDQSDLLDEALETARAGYLQRRPASVAAFDESTQYMPGGNTRTVLFHGPVPLRIESGDGCRIRDADGHSYVNLLGEYTAGLFGHNDPVIRSAINRALDNGINLSAHNPDEIELARLVCNRFPSIDKVRFTNSGTEANLLAVSIARFITRCKKVLVFEGGYHGGLLYFRGGGMPINAPFDYLVADYNNIEATRTLIRQHSDDLACVLVEPMQGATGCIPGDPQFLQMLRDECDDNNAILIFDEVMTSRLSPGGMQGLLNIIPDMTTLGKYIGGGMSFGAFGGREAIMNWFDPRRPDMVPHAGTFNNNTLTMAAGAAALGQVLTDDRLNDLNNRGENLRNQLNLLTRELNLKIQFSGIGSLMAMHATDADIHSAKDIKGCDDRVVELIFLDLLERGYYIARRGFIALMLPHTDQELDEFVEVMREVLMARVNLLR